MSSTLSSGGSPVLGEVLVEPKMGKQLVSNWSFASIVSSSHKMEMSSFSFLEYQNLDTNMASERSRSRRVELALGRLTSPTSTPTE